MARRCEICDKSLTFGHTVSHSNRKTNRYWAPNLQSVKANINGQVKRVRVCTRCLRSGKVTRAI